METKVDAVTLKWWIDRCGELEKDCDRLRIEIKELEETNEYLRSKLPLFVKED